VAPVIDERSKESSTPTPTTTKTDIKKEVNFDFSFQHLEEIIDHSIFVVSIDSNQRLSDIKISGGGLHTIASSEILSS
tara:strand:+ start:280 stop:513 length:234 start_codon:yes stop_codon:yes gene_type:complete